MGIALTALPMPHLAAQTCTIDSTVLTGTNRTVYINSANTCNAWVLTYQSTGFTGLSVEVDVSNDNSTWTAATSNVLIGTNPSTDLYGMIQLYAYGPFVSVDLSSVTGSGTVTWQLKGSNGVLAFANSGSGGGGGSCATLGGDLTGTCAAADVVNLSNVTNASLANSGLVHDAATVNGVSCVLGTPCVINALPDGAASGDLNGTYPGPGVINLAHVMNGSLANSGLAHTTITINGTVCTLGGSCTISGGGGAGSGGIAQSASNTAGAMPYTFAFPSNVTSGDLLVALGFRNSVLTNPCNVSDTLSNGWNIAYFDGSGGGFPNQISMSWTISASSGADTVSTCSGSSGIVIAEIIPPLGTSVDVTGTSTSGSPLITPTQSNDIFITSSMYNCSSPTATVSTPEMLMQSFADGAGHCLAMSLIVIPGFGGSTASTQVDGAGSSSNVYATMAFKSH